MATYTSNYNLEKPAQTDLYNVDVFNGNMDIVDAVLGKHETGIAAIEPNETASTNYSAGQYIMWHSTLYKTRVAISAGEAFTSANLIEAHVGNRLYAIETQLAGIDAKIKLITSASSGASVTLNVTEGCRCLLAVLGFGNISCVWAVFRGSSSTPKLTKIGGGASINMTAGAGTITISNSDTGNGMYIYGIALSGNLPTA